MKRARPAQGGRFLYRWAIPVLLEILLNGCGQLSHTETPTAGTAPEAPTQAGTVTSVTPTATSTPQPTATPVIYGPDPAHFPAGINPLTGEPAADPALLKVPALLVSISHFPVEARPQAGLSFAPYVFEYSITEGATRFLTAFYGQYPAPEIPIKGNCGVRQGVFTQSGTLLGNRSGWMPTRTESRTPSSRGSAAYASTSMMQREMSSARRPPT